MRLLIVFSSLAAATLAYPGGHGADVYHYQSYHGPYAPLAHDGRVVDTPEVAHAKAAHYKAYHEQLSKTPSHGPGIGDFSGGGYSGGDIGGASYHHQPEHHAYHGPPAPLGKDGRVVDTPEVAHAKAAHFHAVADELSKVSYHSGPEHHDGPSVGGGGGYFF